MNKRFSHKRLILFTMVIAVCFSMSLLVVWQEADSQTKVKLGDLLTGLRSTKLTSMEKKNELLAGAVRQRGVDFILTDQIETILRAEGANDDLINAVRENSLKPKSTPTPTPPKTSGKTFTNAIGMEFVRILAGSFMMGSPSDEKARDSNEGPQHRVIISKDFWMGKYEVTQAEYGKVMGTNPSSFKDCPKCPVESVNWNDAQEFIKRLNGMGSDTYRLPTEAEWEYAARAGTTTPFGIGDGKNLSSDESNFNGDYPYGNARKGKYLGKTSEVGSYQPNAWGLYDMHGNVYEWVNDWYGSYSSGSVKDQTGPTIGSNRIFRGGSWITYSGLLRSAYRNNRSPSDSSYDLGFRIIRE